MEIDPYTCIDVIKALEALPLGRQGLVEEYALRLRQGRSGEYQRWYALWLTPEERRLGELLAGATTVT